MRHLEANMTEEEPKDDKAYYFIDEEIKTDIPNLIIDENFIKTEFLNDDDSFISGNISFQIEGSETEQDQDDADTPKIRRKRRKALTPQKAVQLELSRGSVGNSSESSEVSEKANKTDNKEEDLNLLSDTEPIFDLCETDELLQDINEDDIFKDIQEEADGEKLDEEIIDNVKEEWRAHWGIKCNMCEQVFPFKTDFDKHYQTNYNLVPVYTCTFCNKSAEKYSTFRSHCYRHITEGRYKCKECPKGFSLQSMLHVHVLARHTKAKPFSCEECGKNFVTKPGLKIHIKKHKAEVKEDYPCVECGKILHTRGGLTSHMNVHRLGRRFMCDVCGKTFTQKVNMQQHVKQHTGDKPHGCDKCGKTFAERSHLVRHYSFHSQERPYKCEVCQKMYKTERCLKVHSLVHAAERPFVCGYCNKGFLSSTKLKQHYNIHTGERPYKCKYCERTFTNYPNWLKHVRRRHKVDHRTGEELPPKVPKEEVPQTPPAPVEPVQNSTETTDPLLADITLTKTEEMLLQQGLFNFPLIDEKFIFNQQLDLTGGSTSNTSILTPYFQTAIPNHQTIITSAPTTIPIQFNDMVHTTFIQQT